MAWDVLVLQPSGEPWDSTVAANRLRAKRLLKSERPQLLVGSPMCTLFSQMQNLNRAKMGEEAFQEKLEKALAHMEFACELYLQ